MRLTQATLIMLFFALFVIAVLAAIVTHLVLPSLEASHD